MQLLTDPDAVRARVLAWKAAGLRVGLVPTMGALHRGHTGLVEAARVAGADRVVVSIFVNPTQFGPTEDLGSYPRDPNGDSAKLEAVGTDLLFMPAPGAIYPPGAETQVSLSRLPQHLCGLSRPHHFGGVATVVTILFNIVQPHVAVFGEKDYQQLRVIQRLTRDLHLPVRIVGAPIARESDGLALSSRNVYLSADERARATALCRALEDAQAELEAGQLDATLLAGAMARTCEEAGGRVDYAAIVNEETLEAVPSVTGPVRALLAVHFGRARLLDNRRLTPASADHC